MKTFMKFLLAVHFCLVLSVNCLSQNYVMAQLPQPDSDLTYKLTENQPALFSVDSKITEDQTYNCVTAISETEEVELSLVRHSNGTVDAYKTVRPLRAGTTVSMYSIDVSFGSNSDGTIRLDLPSNVPFTIFSFQPSGGYAPVGGLPCIRCNCCTGVGGSGAGSCDVHNQGTNYASCLNTGCFRPTGADSTSVSCGSENCGSGTVPREGWVVMQVNSSNVTMH